MSSVVYFISNNDGLIKIGFSADLKARMASFKIANPTGGFDLLGTVPGAKPEERAIHQHLNAIRHSGEWFVDCPEIRAFLDVALTSGLDAAGVKVEAKKPRFPKQHEELALSSAKTMLILKDILGASSLADIALISGVPEKLLIDVLYRPKPSGLTVGNWILLIDGAKKCVDRAALRFADLAKASEKASEFKNALSERASMSLQEQYPNFDRPMDGSRSEAVADGAQR